MKIPSFFILSIQISDRCFEPLNFATSQRLEKLRENVNKSIQNAQTKTLGYVLFDPVVSYTLIEVWKTENTEKHTNTERKKEWKKYEQTDKKRKRKSKK